MKKGLSRIIVAAMSVFVCAATVSAQNDAIAAAAGDKYVISAKAGGANFVAGTVSITRAEGKSGLLLKGDRLEIGDKVTTGPDGRAEVLLNPGSYLRLGPNSSFQFESIALDDLQIRLNSGSAVFEVFATEDFVVTVSSPKTKMKLFESGVYRVDVAADGSGKIAVWKGRAQIGEDERALVKSGREAEMAGQQASIVKFDRDDKDELEIWSKERAKELAKITGRLQKDNMRTALMRSFLGRQWNMYSSFGLWVYDPFRGSHCFLPFGWGWGSPYGFGFGSNIWYYNLPQVVYQPPQNGTGPVRTIRTSKPGRVVDEQVRPPFAQVQGTSGSTGRDVSIVKPGRAVDINSPAFPDPVRSTGFPTGSGGGGDSSSAPAPRVVLDSKPIRPNNR